MKLIEQKEYVLKRGVPLPNGQVFLTKPLFVYKKIATYPATDDKVIDKRFNKTDPGFSSDAPFHKPSSKNRGIIEAADKYIAMSMDEEEAIANLVIVPGSIVNLPQGYERKMRANNAIVHSITRIGDSKGVAFGVSSYEQEFVYTSAAYFHGRDADHKGLKEMFCSKYDNLDRPDWMNKHIVTPEHQFSTTTWDCSSGIHFFLEAQNALDY